MTSPTDRRLESAGLLRRFLAYLIDILPITAACLAVILLAWPPFASDFAERFGPNGDDPEVRTRFLMVRNLARDASACVYLALGYLCEAYASTTPGKHLLSLEIVGPDGEPLTLARAASRAAFKPLSILCCFGALTSLFDAQGRTLHDILSGSRVVRRRPR